MNFIFIMSDTFRFDNLACYTKNYPRFATKHREIVTPNLDRFAEVSTIFDRSYVGSYPTVPNRTDILTGQMRPFKTWAPLAKDATTFVGLLGDKGYTTQMIQDAPHTLNKGFHFDRDFDGWERVRGQESDGVASTPLPEPGDPKKTRGNGAWGQHLANLAITRQCEQDCYCAKTMTAATHWLERNYKLDKFFLYIDTFDPHEPWDAPQWYEDMYDPGYKGISYRYPIYGPASTYTKSELNHMRACYAGEATLVDRWVGHLLESIERMGLLENTCVVFTADHGICVGDHGWTGKNAPPLYEEVAHTPLIVHMPGQTKSRHVKELTQPVDLMPTFLDLAKVRTPKGLQQDGVSLKPALEGKSRKLRDYAFSRGGKGLVITDREWSLVYASTVKGGAGADCAPELFNLVKDPTQTKNVLKRNIAQARRMWDAYDAWLQEGGVVDGSAEKSPRP